MDMTILTYKKLLTGSVLFAGMKDDTLLSAVRLMKGRISFYPKGSFPHRAGEPMTAFGLVLSGCVQALRDDPEGNRIIMAEVPRGITFGEALCFLEIPDSPVCICASEETAVLWLSPKALYEGDADPLSLQLQKRFTALLAGRTLAMHDRVVVLSQLSIREKLLVYFDGLQTNAGQESFVLPFNREDMAAYIGTNRSSLSRELSRMKAEGLIDYDRNRFRLLRRGKI